ncbi:hypothetical protein TWF694_008682 [Orbilia ellipsospora]|uniref:Uncharacterized protein n=1 Tax=Orbilia ellipsospora TaxID=2528407 RepID=A0AAV9XD10_9PEZI
MPPSGAGAMVGSSEPLPKAPDVDVTDPESGDDEGSLDRFLDSYGNVAPDSRGKGGEGDPYHDNGGNRFPNTFTGGPGWFPPPHTILSSSRSIPSYPLQSESNVYTLPSYMTTICLTDKHGSTISTTVITNPSDVHSTTSIDQTDTAISYKTVTADNTGTVTDTATVVLTGTEATRVLFPQHDKSGSQPPPPHPPAKARLRDILLGVFLGAGLVLLVVACLFGYRAYKRKTKSRRSESGDNPSDSEQPRQGTPEMQSTGIAITMPSMADAHIPSASPSPPPPFANQPDTLVHSDSPEFVLPSNNVPETPIIINPFSDPTYNSSSAIEDYVVSNGAPLGREPENPFLHPDDPSLGVLQHLRPNSMGDFPPEYATVDSNPLDSSGQRIREERFPFGDEALSVRIGSDTGSVRHESISESIPDYQYDDPNGVADGFRYNSPIPGRLPH